VEGMSRWKVSSGTRAMIWKAQVALCLRKAVEREVMSIALGSRHVVLNESIRVPLMMGYIALLSNALLPRSWCCTIEG
jgi:hypothetical protein